MSSQILDVWFRIEFPTKEDNHLANTILQLSVVWLIEKQENSSEDNYCNKNLLNTPTERKPRLLEICLSRADLGWLLWEFVERYRTNVNSRKNVGNLSTGLFWGFRGRAGELRAASFTCNKKEYGKRKNLGQSNIKFLVFSKLSNLTLSAKNYAETTKLDLEHCEVLLSNSVFFYFVQPRQSHAFLIYN